MCFLRRPIFHSKLLKYSKGSLIYDYLKGLFLEFRRLKYPNVTHLLEPLLPIFVIPVKNRSLITPHCAKTIFGYKNFLGEFSTQSKRKFQHENFCGL